jgi:transcriptional regulator with XRE-family HTH domain
MVLQLRDAVRADGRSLNELEKLSGLARGQLSRFVNGKRDLTLDAAAGLCDTLGITFNLPTTDGGKPAKAKGKAKRHPGRKGQ